MALGGNEWKNYEIQIPLRVLGMLKWEKNTLVFSLPLCMYEQAT